MDQKSLFGLSEHLEMQSQHGDPQEVLERTIDFEYFRSWLVVESIRSAPVTTRAFISYARCAAIRSAISVTALTLEDADRGLRRATPRR